MPLTTATSSLYLGTMPIPTGTATQGGATATTTGSDTVTTCTGTLITPPNSPMDCDMLSETYNVTTGDLTVLTDDWGCRVEKPICAPPPCNVTRIGWYETW